MTALVLGRLGQAWTLTKVWFGAAMQRGWVAAIVGGIEDWQEVPAAELQCVGWLLRYRAVIVELVLSWMVGLPHQPLGRRPRLGAAHSLSMKAV